MADNAEPQLCEAKKYTPVHACPKKGEAVTPCCGRIVFELPLYDRMTRDERQVTCKGANPLHG